MPFPLTALQSRLGAAGGGLSTSNLQVEKARAVADLQHTSMDGRTTSTIRSKPAGRRRHSAGGNSIRNQN